MSLMSEYFKDYVSFPEGSLEDEETLGDLLECAAHARQPIKVKLKDEVFYIVHPGDTKETIVTHRERRMLEDRRKVVRRLGDIDQSFDRRREDRRQGPSESE